ncbi:putative sugar O-methyltransferase [Desulfospira joergensenii]|uniref:putative sugar O-methyltransferase n=1 Tax=Desulfospira joergensenii TaxID=53329 RepID=UPI001377465C|nr:putative sugar O-methyltransferase [Desulfospira joergensenii]
MDVMLSDLKAAPKIYQPTNFWSSLLAQVITNIRQFGIESFRKEDVRTHFVPHYRKEEEQYFVSAMDDYRIFLAADQDVEPRLSHISESKVGNPTQHYLFGKNWYSRSMLNYLRGLTFLKKNVDTSSIRRVLEIGGGYGTLGEVFLKSNFERYCYIDIDIPPTAYIATRYLQEVFGKRHTLEYSLTRGNERIEIDEIEKSYKSAVLMPWQIPCLRGKVDLFVNFFSFQEMEPAVVENYAKFVDKCRPDYLLLRNQRGGQKLAEKPGKVGVIKQTTREDYIRFFPNYECLAIDSKIFGCIKEEFKSEVMVFKRKSR